MYSFFQEYIFFYNAQYGFRTEHSTEFASIELVDRIIVEMDKMNTPISIFRDLSKAFNTLDHGILLSKLKYYGLNGTSLQLMEIYISNRKQYVTIDGTDSEPSQITTGSPKAQFLVLYFSLFIFMILSMLVICSNL